MRTKALLLSSLALLAVSWSAAPPGAEAISCANVSNVTLLPTAGCDFGGLTFSNFSVSASAGFTAATVGVGPSSTSSPTNVNLIYQLSSTPSPRAHANTSRSAVAPRISHSSLKRHTRDRKV